MGVPALVLAALVLPWTALALPSLGAVTAPGSQATAPRPDSDAALASMLLGPSAAVPTSPAAGPSAGKTSAGTTGRALDAAGAPERIVVPALGVNAPVVPISGENGTLLPPSNASSIGWWREGPQPGAGSGTSVLTGHTVHTGGGAFDHLDRLRPGDTVLVRTTAGWVHYAVQRSTSYRKGKLAARASTIFRPSGPGRLVLVTCSHFNGREYLANTVVYAVPVARDASRPGAGPVSG